MTSGYPSLSRSWIEMPSQLPFERSGPVPDADVQYFSYFFDVGFHLKATMRVSVDVSSVLWTRATISSVPSLSRSAMAGVAGPRTYTFVSGVPVEMTSSCSHVWPLRMRMTPPRAGMP
jgi:hypothetical protein